MRLWRNLFVFLVVCFLCDGARAAQIVRANTDLRVVQIEFHSMLDVAPSHGFIPVRISVNNRLDRAAAWQFEFRSGQQTGEMNHFAHAVGIRLEAGESRIVEVMAPVYPVPASHSWPALSVTMSGPGLESERARLYSGGHHSTRSGAFLAMTSSVANRNKSAVEQQSGRAGGHGVGQVATLYLNALSEDVRGFSGVDVLLMTAEEWADLEGGQRYVLTQWIARGGHLFLVDESGGNLPRGLRGDAPSAGPVPIGWGTAQMFGESAGGILEPDTLLREVGKALALTPQTQDMNFTSRDWALRREIRDLHRPAGLIMTTVIAVAALLGPVNVMVASRRKRPVQLLWVTPLLSVGLSLLMMLVILLYDGVGGQGARSLTVFLLPEHNLEVIRQEQVSRTGVLLTRDMRLPRGTEVRMLNVEGVNPHHFGGFVSGRFELSGEDLWRGNWFSSRAIQGQSLQLSRPNRAQLALYAGADGTPPELLSSLDAPLKTVFVQDFEGNHWRAGPVRPGNRVRLEPATERDAEQFERRLTLRTGERVSPARGNGTFLAEADPEDDAFLATLGGIRWENHAVRYTGFLVRGGGQ